MTLGRWLAFVWLCMAFAFAWAAIVTATALLWIAHKLLGGSDE